MRALFLFIAAATLSGCSSDVLDSRFAERKQAHLARGLSEREAEDMVFREMTGEGEDGDTELSGLGRR